MTKRRSLKKSIHRSVHEKAIKSIEMHTKYFFVAISSPDKFNITFHDFGIGVADNDSPNGGDKIVSIVDVITY